MPEKFTVLLVDDSRTSRMMTALALRKKYPDIVVLEAGSGDAALALLENEEADAAILDMNMPGMSGLELAEELRKRRPTMHLAMLTANVQDAVRKKAAQLQLDFYGKPLTEASMEKIAHAFQQST